MSTWYMVGAWYIFYNMYTHVQLMVSRCSWKTGNSNSYLPPKPIFHPPGLAVWISSCNTTHSTATTSTALICCSWTEVQLSTKEGRDGFLLANCAIQSWINNCNYIPKSLHSQLLLTLLLVQLPHTLISLYSLITSTQPTRLQCTYRLWPGTLPKVIHCKLVCTLFGSEAVTQITLPGLK